MINRLLDRVRAFFRKEEKIQGPAVRGRIYQKKDAPRGGSSINVSAGPTATCRAVVTRADGTEEVHVLPVSITKE